MKRNLFIIGIVLATLLIVGSVIAEEEVIPNTPFNLIDWIKYTINFQSFSVVGATKECTESPLFQHTFNNEDYINIDGSSYCGSGYETLLDVFSGTSPYKEYRNKLANNQLKCGNVAGCRVQVYCCNEPTEGCTVGTNSGCAWNGANSICTAANCVSWINNGYRCTSTYEEPLNGIPYYTNSFNYCSNNVFAKCYYFDGTGTTCTKFNTYNGVTECPDVLYQGLYKLYLSQSECNNNIQTCNNQGQSCGGPSNLQSGKPCCSGLTCQNFQCVSPSQIVCGNGNCETGETFSSCPTDCGIIPVCGNGVCDSGENVGGTYDCPQDCKNEITTSHNTCIVNSNYIWKSDDNDYCSGFNDFSKILNCISDSKCSFQPNGGICYGSVGTCVLKSVPDNTTTTTGTSITNLKKISLTRDVISTAPTPELFASACYDSKECLENVNYTVKCVKLKSLEDDGTLPKTESDDFLTQGKGYVDAAIGGATLGSIAGLSLCVAAAVGSATLIGPGAGIVYGSCALIGAYIGAGASYSLKNIYKPEDPLVKAFQSKDASAVGICTAEEKSSLEILKTFAWFDINGDGKKDSTDGMIILIGGIVLLFFILIIAKK